MKLHSKTKVLCATSIFCYLLVHLLFVVFFPFMANPFDIGKLKPSKSNGEIQNKGAEKDTKVEEPLQFGLKRLVRGNDRIQLDKTGFACHSDFHTDVCVASRPVVMDAKSLKLYVPSAEVKYKRTVRPYARKEDALTMKKVAPVIISQKSTNLDLSACNFSHSVPALVFSSGGYTGNQFHEINEVIIPLFITSRNFRSNVQFVISDYKPWLVSKYNQILSHLSRYEVINPAENGSVHCFPGAVVGLKYHDNLALNSTEIPGGYSMFDFKHFLRQAYNLNISHVPRRGKPVLVLISRSYSRMFLNEDEMEEMMVGLGFEVVVVPPYRMANMVNLSRLLSICSVLVGAHGAGLANEVFLPAGAVVVQVVPLGLDWASNAYYAEPASGMGLRYLEYKIDPDESSLLTKYGSDHPVITAPNSVFQLGGYEAAKAVYVDGQNLKINLVRFRETMLRAIKLLGRSIPLA